MKYNENPKTFPGLYPKSHQGSALDPRPPKPPTDYSDCCTIVFSK